MESITINIAHAKIMLCIQNKIPYILIWVQFMNLN